MILKHLFIPYELALKLKEKGFDEPCLSVYDEMGFVQSEKIMDELNLKKTHAPTYDQTFDWFREKYKYLYGIADIEIGSLGKVGYRFRFQIWKLALEESYLDDTLLGYLTYKEAQIACIEKMLTLI